MYLVQSIIFDKSKFNLEQARQFLKENKYKDKGVDEKKNFWRFRQYNPLTVRRKGYSHYITKPLENGIELIIAYKEKLEGTGKLNQIKKSLFTDPKHVEGKPNIELKIEEKDVEGGKLKASHIKGFINQSYEEFPEASINGWVLDQSLSNDNAKVYYNPTSKEAVITHRGTQGVTDWGNNIAYAFGVYGMTDRYNQGKAVQDKAIAKYGASNISTLGHSQGAILSRRLGDKTKEIINLNPAYSGEIPLKNEYNIRSSADVVSGLYKPVSTIRSVFYPTYTKKHDIVIPSDSSFDVLGNHSADILDKLGDQEIGAGLMIKKLKSKK
jgi:hypothetical protein